jgi:NADH-quinone oxidoreductase subunit C
VADTEAPEAEAPATDEARDAIVEAFRSHLGDGFVDSRVDPGHDVWIRVTRDAWRAAGLVARDQLGCGHFSFLSALDWLPSPDGKNEDSSLDPKVVTPGEIVTGYAGGDTRFQVFARVTSLTKKTGITIKADLPEDDLTVDSWLPVYPGVNWHEREAHEMFGIGFNGHPHLVNLYLPGGFEGHPMRKDFPLLAREIKPWPGLVDVEPMPDEGDDAEAAATDDTEAEA